MIVRCRIRRSKCCCPFLSTHLRHLQLALLPVAILSTTGACLEVQHVVRHHLHGERATRVAGRRPPVRPQRGAPRPRAWSGGPGSAAHGKARTKRIPNTARRIARGGGPCKTRLPPESGSPFSGELGVWGISGLPHAPHPPLHPHTPHTTRTHRRTAAPTPAWTRPPTAPARPSAAAACPAAKPPGSPRR